MARLSAFHFATSAARKDSPSAVYVTAPCRSNAYIAALNRPSAKSHAANNATFAAQLGTTLG